MGSLPPALICEMLADARNQFGVSTSAEKVGSPTGTPLGPLDERYIQFPHLQILRVWVPT